MGLSDNYVHVIGNVVRDVSLKFSNSGLAVAEFAIAHNERRRDREEEVSFFDVVCFGTLAENVGECIAKGDRVEVQGKLKQERWETEKGEKRTRVRILADEVSPSLRWASVTITKNERTQERAGTREEAF